MNLGFDSLFCSKAIWFEMLGESDIFFVGAFVVKVVSHISFAATSLLRNCLGLLWFSEKSSGHCRKPSQKLITFSMEQIFEIVRHSLQRTRRWILMFQKKKERQQHLMNPPESMVEEREELMISPLCRMTLIPISPSSSLAFEPSCSYS